MILGFNPRFPEKIKKGIKVHTIREDKHNRWKAGMKIHFATGVRTKNYNQFMEGVCTGIQQIIIKPKQAFILIDNHILDEEEIKILAKNDGFDNTEGFWKWFNKDFSGKIIHWTDCRY